MRRPTLVRPEGGAKVLAFCRPEPDDLSEGEIARLRRCVETDARRVLVQLASHLQAQLDATLTGEGEAG